MGFFSIPVFGFVDMVGLSVRSVPDTLGDLNVSCLTRGVFEYPVSCEILKSLEYLFLSLLDSGALGILRIPGSRTGDLGLLVEPHSPGLIRFSSRNQ